MSNWQQHGIIFEKILFDEIERRLGPVCEISRNLPGEPTARFDVPSWRDPTGRGVPTSIKMSKRMKSGRVRVDLADARRIVRMGEEPFVRFLVGAYNQMEGYKSIDEVYEFIVPSEMWNNAVGEVPLDMIRRFHFAIKEGGHVEARKYASEWKKKVKQYYPGIIHWAPKIDSKNQRRLQCYLYLDELELMVEEFRSEGAEIIKYKIGDVGVWGSKSLSLPFNIEGGPRARSKKAVEST